MQKLRTFILEYGYEIVEESINKITIDDDIGGEYWSIEQNENGTFHIENSVSIYNTEATYDMVIEFLKSL